MGEVIPIWELHPQKNSNRLAKIIARRYIQPGDIVIDPFCGSGTFPIIAAKEVGVQAICIDLEAKYLKWAKQRAKLEGVIDKMRFVKGDCVEVLSKAAKKYKHRFVTITSPPSDQFLPTVSGTNIEVAKKILVEMGYKREELDRMNTHKLIKTFVFEMVKPENPKNPIALEKTPKQRITECQRLWIKVFPLIEEVSWMIIVIMQIVGWLNTYPTKSTLVEEWLFKPKKQLAANRKANTYSKGSKILVYAVEGFEDKVKERCKGKVVLF